MAEGFARTYGADVMHVWSAGLAPAPIVQPLTVQVMDQKNIDIRDQFPKSVDELELNAFDVIVNMSGIPLPVSVRGEVRRWTVVDPITQPEAVYQEVRDQIEALVMQLILDMRRAGQGKTGRMVAAPVRLVKRRVQPAAKPPVKTAQMSQLDPPADPAKPADTSASQTSKRFSFGRVRTNKDDA